MQHSTKIQKFSTRTDHQVDEDTKRDRTNPRQQLRDKRLAKDRFRDVLMYCNYVDGEITPFRR